MKTAAPLPGRGLPDGEERSALKVAATGVMRWLLIGLVFLVLLPQGSVRVTHAAAFAAVAAASAALAILLFGEAGKTRVVHRAVLVGLALLVGWVGVQTTPLEGWSAANPLWGSAEVILGPLSPTISIQPWDGRSATVYLALPILVFCGCLTLFPDDDSALWLLRRLAWLGGAIAAWAIFQFEFFPDTLLFDTKRVYLDSLTGTFVNRNTAATFLGLTALALLLVLVLDARSLRIADLVRWLTSSQVRRSAPRVGWRFPLGILLLAATLAALFLTRSRGGVAATLLAFAIVGPLVAAYSEDGSRAKSHYRSERTSGLRRTVRALFGLFVVIGISLVFAERAAFRAAVQGTEDGRFCVLPGIMALIRSNWPVGTGFGTFRDAFSAYRDGSCGLYGTWDRAHSVYLEALAGLGAPGALAIALTVLGLIVIFAIGVKTRRSLRIAPFAGFGMLVLLLLHSAVDFSLQIPGLSVWAAALLAPLVTLSLGRSERSIPKKQPSKFEEAPNP